MSKYVLLLVVTMAACAQDDVPGNMPRVSSATAGKPGASGPDTAVCQCSPIEDCGEPGCGPCSVSGDLDGDCICTAVDLCTGTVDCTNADADGDGFGDACDVLPNIPDPESTLASLDTRLDVVEAGLGDVGYPTVYPDVNCNGIAAPDEGACSGMALNALGLGVCTALVSGVPCDHYEDLTGGSNTAATCNSSLARLLDLDDDGLGNGCDNCDDVYNPRQVDTDLDGVGDACESS
jgi:hypothetical protein